MVMLETYNKSIICTLVPLLE